MGEGAARRGLGHRHPRPGLGTRKIHPPRWTLGTDTSSQIGGPLARQYRTAQNIWKKRLRISGTHKRSSSRGSAVVEQGSEGYTILLPKNQQYDDCGFSLSARSSWLRTRER